MHELSIAESLMSIVREEMAKHGARRLVAVHICYGALSHVIPEAMDMAFEVTNAGTEYEDAKLVMRMEPAVLLCKKCGLEFTPKNTRGRFEACPKCGNEQGHSVVSGKSLFIENLEVE